MDTLRIILFWHVPFPTSELFRTLPTRVEMVEGILNVLLGKGDHEVSSSWTDEDGDENETTLEITRSNITFVGTGKDTTTILGGFGIRVSKMY